MTNVAGCATTKKAGFKSRLIIPSGPKNIANKPFYSYRGVSLDTSSQQLELIVDATSFSVVSKTYPDLITSHQSHPRIQPPIGNDAPAIDKLIKEYTTLFADSVFHLQGDEIVNFCLAVTKELT
ncbi:UNVERIFIED_CONTAM: hypothetical protein HDU68_010642, partial [Siphonaria sp. JEL0065]